jgi:hypothetical protein
VISVAVIADVKSSGTFGGTFTSGAWRTRDINTEISDPDGIVSLSSNEFTLGAGSYLVEWSAPAYLVDGHQSRLYDVTGTAAVQLGSSGFSSVYYSAAANNFSIGSVLVSPAASNTYRVEHWSTATFANAGFGYYANISSEIYTIVKIIKIA